MIKNAVKMNYLNFLTNVVHPLGIGIFKTLEESLGDCDFSVERSKKGLSFSYHIYEDSEKRPKLLAHVTLGVNGLKASVSKESRLDGLKRYLIKFAKEKGLNRAPSKGYSS